MLAYLAGRYSRIDELNCYAMELRSRGHRVEARWLLGNNQVHDGALAVEAAEDDVPDMGRLFAQDDLADVQAADLVICFTEPPRSIHSRGGRHVEFGLALALRKRIVVIGPRENVFYCLVERYWTWSDFMAAEDQRS